jgi:hypothetical protein
MEQSPSLEANRSSVIQEIPRILLEGSLLCSQQSTTYCYPEPDQCRPLPPSCFLIIRLNVSSHLRPGLQSSLFPCGLPTKLNAPLPVIRSQPGKSSLTSLFTFKWHRNEHRTDICVPTWELQRHQLPHTHTRARARGFLGSSTAEMCGRAYWRRYFSIWASPKPRVP